MKKQSFCLLLAASALLGLSSCGPVSASSSASSLLKSSSSTTVASTSVLPSSSSSPVSSSSSSASSAASSSSSVAIDSKIATLTADTSIPSTAIGTTLNLADHVHFKNAVGEEVPASLVSSAAFALDTMKTAGVGVCYSEENPLLVSAEQVGIVKGQVTCLAADGTTTLKADVSFAITANDDVTALAKKWGALSNNFTLTTGSSLGGRVAVRTPNYVSYGNGSGLVVSAKDNEAYPFTSDKTDLSSITVLPHDRGAGTATLEKAAPSLAIKAENFRNYIALSKALKGTYTYFITGSNLTSTMKTLGFESSLVSTSSGDYYIAFFGIKTTGTDLSLTAYGVSSGSQIASFGDFVFSAVGTSSIASLEKYRTDALAPEKTDVTPLQNKIKTVADGHNYTIDGTAEFYAEDGTTKLDTTAAEAASAFNKAFIADARKPRLLQLTSDGIWMHYYNISESTENAYDEVGVGYLNHKDGTVYTFTMENGSAVLGAQDFDYSTYSATAAPYWNTYKKGLASFSEERIAKASLVKESDAYAYEYIYDEKFGSPEDSLGTTALDTLFPDLYDLFVTSSSGDPIFNAATGSFSFTDTTITVTLSIPLFFTETISSVLKVRLSVKAIGTTSINGLSAILDGTPAGGGDDY